MADNFVVYTETFCVKITKQKAFYLINKLLVRNQTLHPLELIPPFFSF